MKREPTGEWFATFGVEVDREPPTVPDNPGNMDVVGIDVGIMKYAHDTDGHEIGSLDFSEERAGSNASNATLLGYPDRAAETTTDPADLPEDVRAALEDMNYEIVEASEEAAAGDVTVSLDRPTLERIDILTDEGAGVDDWIRTAVDTRLADVDRQLSAEVETEIDVPEDILQHARLRYEALKARGSEPNFGEVMYDYVTFEPRWMADGEPVRNIGEGGTAAAASNAEWERDR